MDAVPTSSSDTLKYQETVNSFLFGAVVESKSRPLSQENPSSLGNYKVGVGGKDAAGFAKTCQMRHLRMKIRQELTSSLVASVSPGNAFNKEACSSGRKQGESIAEWH